MEQLTRMTPATLDVLQALVDAGAEVWGLRLVKVTGRPSGSVYPILERLEGAGWIRSAWEDDPNRSGPRRRLYELTADGAEAAASALASRAERELPARAVRRRNPRLGLA